jgi:hypothetical protein
MPNHGSGQLPSWFNPPTDGKYPGSPAGPGQRSGTLFDFLEGEPESAIFAVILSA